jgi:hypothetical protein
MEHARLTLRMTTPDRTPTQEGPWISLWVVAFLSLVAQLALCQFFSFGQTVPLTIDMNPSNLWKLAYHFPPSGAFYVLNWLGLPNQPFALNPFSLAANWPAWWFFTAYAPLMGTCALLAMAAFLRELELPRPAALFGGVIIAWQGDLLPFVLPGHFAYITFWPFFAVAAWGALRAQRTGHWAYAVISGAACGTMVELPSTADRGAIACLLIAAFYLAPIFFRRESCNVPRNLLQLALCVVTAALISLSSFMSLFQDQIVGVKMGGQSQREQTFNLCTQFSLGPKETVTYLIPGFYGWHTNGEEGPYWGVIGQVDGWEKHHRGARNLNLGISTTGTIATLLALMGALSLFRMGILGPAPLPDRSRFFGLLLLTLGAIALVLSWGYHTSLYRPLFALPLMDKWRNPLKWLEITNFALVTLSAFGVQHLLRSIAGSSPEREIIRRRITLFTGSALFLLVLGFAIYFIIYPALVHDLSKNDGYEAGAIANIMDALKFAMKFAILLTILFAVFLYGIWRPELLRQWVIPNPLLHRAWQRMMQPETFPLTIACFLVLLSVGQLAWVATKFIQPASLAAVTADNPLLDALKAEGDQVRCSVAVEDPLLNVLLLNQFQASDISCLDISAASRIPDDINAFFNSLSMDRARLWFLAGVKNVAAPQEALAQLRSDPGVAANIDHANGYSLLPTGSDNIPSHALIGMHDYLAKATLVHHAAMIPSDDKILHVLDDRSWDPRESVLLNPNNLGQGISALPPEATMQGTAPGPDKVEIAAYTPTDIKINVQSSVPGYVLINDRYDPDWQAQLNGRDTPMLRANFIMRAIAVPPGESTVTLHYVPHYRLNGFVFPANTVALFSDLVMLAAWVIAGLALLRERRTPASL